MLFRSTTPDELLTTLRQGVEQIQRDSADAYTTAKTGWASNTKQLDIKPIEDAFARVQQTVQSRGKPTIGSAEQRVIDEIGNVIAEWKADPAARTALDLDALKRRIDAIYPESPQHTNAQRAVTSVRNAVKDEIVRNTPEYADAMKAYEVQMELLRDINKGLSTGDKVAKETTINKLMSTLKGTPSADLRRQLVSTIEQQGGVNLMPALAGQELTSWAPSSGVGRAVLGGGLTAAYYLHHPELTAILPLTSPRLLGETYYGLGRAAAAGRKGLASMSNLSPAEQAYANALLVEAQQNQNINALSR